MPTLEEIKALLHLHVHPAEGGFFTETYRSEELLAAGTIPGREAARSLSTAIYYLLSPDTFSALHRLGTDEIFHFYMGDPAEMLQLHPGGTGRVVQLGTDLAAGMRPQILVPRGVWQGTRLLPGGAFALLGTTMAPGFDYSDYVPGRREALLREHPAFRDRILALTR